MNRINNLKLPLKNLYSTGFCWAIHYKLVGGFILLSLFGAIGCKKCADCETVIVKEVSPAMAGYPQTDRVTFEACGDELKDMNQEPIIATSSAMGITSTVTSKTTCK